jgi:hypothetical protein
MQPLLNAAAYIVAPAEPQRLQTVSEETIKIALTKTQFAKNKIRVKFSYTFGVAPRVRGFPFGKKMYAELQGKGTCRAKG